jgi:hypothetical protein
MKRCPDYWPTYRQNHKLELAAQQKTRRDEHRPELAAKQRVYNDAHPEECCKHNAKCRGLGFHPLNSWFDGCVQHHIDHSDVIFIAKVMHDSVRHNLKTGEGMAEINALAGAFFTEDWT